MNPINTFERKLLNTMQKFIPILIQEINKSQSHSTRKEWLNEEEMTEKLSISKSTLRRYRVLGLPCSKIGGNWYYKNTEVEEWMEHQKTKF